MGDCSFRYADTFTPVGARKRRRNRLPVDRALLSVSMLRAAEENERYSWMAQCTRT